METAAISFPIFGEGFVLNMPNYIPIFGVKIYLYGIFIALGFILAALYAMRRCKEFGLTQDNILDMVIFAVPSGIIGARLYYILFNPSQYFGAGNWQNIFNIREGGLAVYGGIIGAALAIMIYSRVKRVPFSRLADVGGLGLLIGQAVGRWGNFFNREAFGAETTVPWRMGLTINNSTIYVHPTFLYESLWNIAGLVLLHLFSKKHKKYDGQIFLMYIAWYGFGRYLIEGMRTDSLYLLGSDLRVSQFLAALSFCVATFLLIRNRIRGVITATYELSAEPDFSEQLSVATDANVSETAEPADASAIEPVVEQDTENDALPEEIDAISVDEPETKQD